MCIVTVCIYLGEYPTVHNGFRLFVNHADTQCARITRGHVERHDDKPIPAFCRDVIYAVFFFLYRNRFFAQSSNMSFHVFLNCVIPLGVSAVRMLLDEKYKNRHDKHNCQHCRYRL